MTPSTIARFKSLLEEARFASRSSRKRHELDKFIFEHGDEIVAALKRDVKPHAATESAKPC